MPTKILFLDPVVLLLEMDSKWDSTYIEKVYYAKILIEALFKKWLKIKNCLIQPWVPQEAHIIFLNKMFKILIFIISIFFFKNKKS